MNKISLNIDVDKLDKKRFEVRSFKTKAGETVSVREMKLEVVPLKEVKTLSSGDTWELRKVGFVCEAPTRAERESKTKTSIVGDATQFIDKNAVPNFDRDSKGNEIKVADEEIEIPW